DDDHVDVVVALRLSERPHPRVDHGAGEGVELVGAIQRDGRNTVLHLIKKIAHRQSFRATAVDGCGAGMRSEPHEARARSRPERALWYVRIGVVVRSRSAVEARGEPASIQERSAATLIGPARQSFGRPSTRSARMFLKISDVPARMPLPRASSS